MYISPKRYTQARSYTFVPNNQELQSNPNAQNQERGCGMFMWWNVTAQLKRSTSQSYRKSTLTIHWKDSCWSWSSNTLATWWEELPGKDPDAGKDWKWEEKGTTEDDLVGWHHRLNGHEFEQAPGVGEGQESLACCSPWGHKESDTTERLNWTHRLRCSYKNETRISYLLTKKN